VEDFRLLKVATGGGKSGMISAVMGLVSISGGAMDFLEQAR
jgi:hypothetical protein